VFDPPPPIDPYEAWLEVNELGERRAALLRSQLEEIDEMPLISVVMPVFDPPLELLARAIRTVVDQIYPSWELCIADDASSDVSVRELLEEWSHRDERIKLVRREENGHISRATNSAAELAEGEYVAFLDHDDELALDALAEVALHAASHGPFDVLYTDDDHIDVDGRRSVPHFKPDWSPELLLSYMYMGHLLVVRRELFERVGGLREGFEGSQDHDLALRLTERTDRVAHVPRVLYHWRVVPGSTAWSGNEKPYSFDAGERAVQEALARRGVDAEAFRPAWARQAGFGVFDLRFRDQGPSVAVLVPTRNQHELLAACLDSLHRTTYRNYEVLVVDNESDDPRAVEYLARCPHRVLRVATDGRFSFARLVNQAVAATNADYVLLLNNDTEVRSPEWLSQMVGYLGMPGVGAVGARLLFPDGRIQHAGVVHGLHRGIAGHAFKLLPGDRPGYMSYARVARNYSAVTGACLLVRRELFVSLGGFDEERFAVAFNDVDFCYRLVNAGFRVVYCPDAELYHHEGGSRGTAADPAEFAAFRERYGDRGDPYYNPNLSLEHERFPIGSRTLTPRIDRPIRTAMFAFTLNWEGAPYSQYELTLRLRDTGVIDPVVCSPSDGPLRSAYEDAGIETVVTAPPTAGADSLETYSTQLGVLADRLRDWDAELVYGNTVQTFYAIDAAREAGLPSIWNPRESENWWTYFDFLPPEIATRALECFATPYQVVFVANSTREAWRALDVRRNATTVANGLDLSRFRSAIPPRSESRRRLGLDDDAVVALSVGTVCARKGQLDLVQGIAEMPREAVSRLQAFVVGDRDGPYSDLLHEAVGNLDAERRERITIIPETRDVGRYYAAADLFVCTSRIESYPRVILEAMAAGLPIVTTPVFGIAEQVQRGVNALTFDPGDAEALGDTLARLVVDAGQRTRMARNSPLVLAALPGYSEMVASYSALFREAWVTGRPRGIRTHSTPRVAENPLVDAIVGRT
jgi:GT2 family glycosyltransferase/glycosyltransferase involved in cell wall biosynthesis